MTKLKRKLATVELADGTVYEDIRIINPDQLRYGETAQRHGWPSIQIAAKSSGGSGAGTIPHLDYEDTFLAWAALRRLGLYEGKWEEFRDFDCVAVEIEDVAADPTQPAPPDGLDDADSSSSSPTTALATASSS